MKSLIILPLCFALAVGAGHPYSFGYSTVDGQSRQESGNGNGVTGSYSYIDANGDQRQVRYVADALGFRAEGDVSVDRRTAAAAAALSALAPRAPIAHSAPIAPAFTSYAAPLPAPYAAPLAAPFSSYSTSIQHTGQYAAPILAQQYAAPALLRSYTVDTPTHRIYAQI